MTAKVLEGSKLPLCVIRRVSTGQKKEETDQESWLQCNIFHTQVEHNEKALNLIIDNGSSINVLSQNIVNKLQLPVEKHPMPYKLSGVDDSSIPVFKYNFSRQALHGYSMMRRGAH